MENGQLLLAPLIRFRLFTPSFALTGLRCLRTLPLMTTRQFCIRYSFKFPKHFVYWGFALSSIACATGCNSEFVAGVVDRLPSQLVGRVQSVSQQEDVNDLDSPLISMPRLLSSPTDLVDAPLQAVEHADPQSVANGFLSAIRIGDHLATQNLLTGSSQAALKQQGLQPLTPGKLTAFFHVGTVEYLDDQTSAYVQCVWSAEQSRDRREGQEMTLVLRHETEGWRVAGLVSHDATSPVIFDFEQPQDLTGSVTPGSVTP